MIVLASFNAFFSLNQSPGFMLAAHSETMHCANLYIQLRARTEITENYVRAKEMGWSVRRMLLNMDCTSRGISQDSCEGVPDAIMTLDDMASELAA